LVAVLLVSILLAGLPADAGNDPSKLPFAVKVVGKGRPMILIPGLMCSGDVWNSTVEHYKRNYECHVLTLAGFAGQPPVAGPFLETMRQGIADYIRLHKLEKPVIIGHSLGGFLVFALGARELDLVGPLVAVDGVPCLPAIFNDKIDAQTLKKQAEQMQQRMAKAPREQYLAQSKALIEHWISAIKERAAAEKWAEDSDQPTVTRAMGELMGTDLRPELGRIKAPVLLLGA
jgi:pimeloyl-ACP methyl ester carboxylesterase